MNVTTPLENAPEWAEPEWVLEHLQDPRVRLVECSHGAHLYDEGHLPCAHLLDWQGDLLMGRGVDEADSLYFDYLCLQRGITRETACIFYGSEAGEAAGIFRRFGYRNGKILRGGKQEWIRRGFPLSYKGTRVQSRRSLSVAEIVSVRCYSHEW